MSIFLSRFRSLVPKAVKSQDELLDWIADTHAHASQELNPTEREAVRADVRARLAHYGCPSKSISQRGTELEDYTHYDRDKMHIFGDESATGRGLAERSRIFGESADSAFARFYPSGSQTPSDIIHVTCTGYISPSGAQRLVAEKGWNRETRVTHAYHMGCYASMPAIRIAAGLLSIPESVLSSRAVDIVHTELCTLHFNPSLKTPDQLIVQSLFADGLIKYSAGALPTGGEPALEVLALREEMVSKTSDDMSWITTEAGFRMTLSRDVPEKIGSALMPYLEQLFSGAGLDYDTEKSSAIFAIHPGGPRIIDRLQEMLVLEQAQVQSSREILFECGNMSSATLPFIWKRILEGENAPSGKLVVSLAFGPGLTISGGLFRVARAGQ